MNRIILDGDSRDFLSYRWSSGRTVEIFDIAVGTERGKGKGRRLVNLLLDRVRGKTHLVFAITRSTNLIAQEFYYRIGFARIAFLWDFYEDEGAVMYGYYLKKSTNGGSNE